jgi:hypothetical protein
LLLPAPSEEILPVQKPSTCADEYWLYASYPPKKFMDVACIGKWLIFVPRSQIDDVWERVETDIKLGKLGYSAKVSTAMKNKKPDHVICVYVTPFNKDDVKSHLNIMGFERTPYKSNELTSAKAGLLRPRPSDDELWARMTAGKKKMDRLAGRRAAYARREEVSK